MKLQLAHLLASARHLLVVQDPFGKAIVGVILGLTVLGLLAAIVLLLRALHDQLQMGRLATSQTPHHPEVLRARFSRGLLGTRITLLESSRQSGCPMPQAVLAAISKAQLEGGVLAQAAHHTSEILFPLGLLGTFVGLGLALYEVGSLLAAVPRDRGLHEVLESLTASLTQIEATMSGLSVAVATSIAGIVGTILTASAGRLVDAAQGKVLLRLEQLTAMHLLPVFSNDGEVVLNRMLSTLENQAGGLARQIAGFNQSLGQGVEAVRERIGEIVAETREQGQRLAAVIGSLHDSVNSAAVTFDEKVTSSSSVFAAAVHEATADVRAAGESFGVGVRKAEAEFSRQVGASGSTLVASADKASTVVLGVAERASSELLAGVQAADSRLDETIEATLRSAAIHRQAINRYAEITELYCGHNRDLGESVRQLTGVVEANDRRILDLNVDGRSFVDVMGEVAQVLVVREQNLQAAEILFNEWLVRVSGALNTLATEVRAAAAADIHEARGELREAATSVRTLVDERTALTHELQSAHDELRKTATRVGAMAGDQAAGAAELRDARSDLQDLGGTVRTLIAQLEPARRDLGKRPHGGAAAPAVPLWSSLLSAIGFRRE